MSVLKVTTDEAHKIGKNKLLSPVIGTVQASTNFSGDLTELITLRLIGVLPCQILVSFADSNESAWEVGEMLTKLKMRAYFLVGDIRWVTRASAVYTSSNAYSGSFIRNLSFISQYCIYRP